MPKFKTPSGATVTLPDGHPAIPNYDPSYKAPTDEPEAEAGVEGSEETEPGNDDAPADDGLDDMNVDQLRELCKGLELSYSGTKEQIIARLREAAASE